MRYINYARRSSDEKSKKQVQSIEDQLSDTRRYAQTASLQVSAEMTESRSAKEPGRPVFNAMIDKIRKGEAEAILCWKLDRLARNPIDAATLRWMMRQGHLLEIRTPYQVYRPEDNAVITAVESAMAEQYIIDLKKGVERGMKSKCEKGGFPFMAPQGYRNDRLQQSVETDPERFPLLQKAWRLLHTGQYTVPEIHHLLVNEWGYRSRTNGVSPDGRLTCSGLYKIFRNSFYMGEFRFQGITYRHRFPCMLTAEEWQRAQAVLDRRARKSQGQSRGKNYHAHTYTGLLTCASCGYSVTAEISKGHTYYHCANRFGTCTKKGIREEEITARIDQLLQSVTLDAEFEAFALRVLDELQERVLAEAKVVAASQHDTLEGISKQKDALLSLFLAGHLTQDEYAAKKAELSKQERALASSGNGSVPVPESIDGVVKEVIRFSTHARSLFRDGDRELRRRIAGSVGKSYVLNNGRELEVELHPLLVPVRTSWKPQWRERQNVEPAESGSGNLKKPMVGPEFQRWCTTLLKYRQQMEQENSFFPSLVNEPRVFAKETYALANQVVLSEYPDNVEA